MADTLNLMIGTSPTGQGGIATVIRGYMDYGLFNKYNIRFIATHHSQTQSRLGMLLVFAKSLLLLLWLGCTHKLGWAHVHLASRGSFKRKHWVVKLARVLGAKIIIHLHGGEFASFYAQQSERSKRNIEKFFRDADRVLPLSQQTATWLAQLCNRSDHIRVLYNAVPQFNTADAERDPQQVLFLGHIGDRKGIFDLLPAFAKVLRTHPEARLRIGGVGEMDKLRQMVADLGIADHVDILGWVVGPQKLAELAKAAVFCLPSNNEAMPMGVLEAMSASMVVITTTVGGIPEIITHGSNGLLFQAGDQDALRDCLQQVLDDQNLQAKLSTAAKHTFDTHLSEDVIFGQLETIYAAVAK